MGLNKYKLGALIELTDERNTKGAFTVEDVQGISTEKSFIATKANMDGVSLDSYKIVKFNEFAYVPDTSRRGDKIALAYNNSRSSVIISSIYITFKCKRLDLLMPEYLYMYFNRPEFDRYARFSSWGSARETFSWDDFCDIEIALPDIEQQRKYVNVYLALQKNLEAYQSKVEDLKIVCDGYLDNLKRTSSVVKLQKYIVQCDEKNSDNQYTLENLRGISIQKKFIDSKADMNGVSLAPYLLVRPKSFAFVPVTSRNGEKITLGFNDSDNCFIVSSSYVVFRVKDHKELLPDYLFIFLNRTEFDRYARFNSWGSAREVFTMEDMKDVAIPVSDISIQQEIVNIHNCYIERQQIAAQLKEQLKNLCPILIKGSLQTDN